jgi:hypothetical protein
LARIILSHALIRINPLRHVKKRTSGYLWTD